ncbi:MAG: group II intron reverse transcriptase/maturase [Minisyncoccia bacterium]
MNGLDRIRSKATRDRKCKFTSLVHLVNEGNLRSCFTRLKVGKASGVDSVTKEAYGQDLGKNIKALVAKLKSKQYRPQPVRRVYIPKPGKDEKRMLGIPATEDKIVQSNVKEILESIYEPEFLDCSYGFRPGRSCHDAIRSLDRSVMTKPINYVVEVDIKKFFDRVNHDTMMRCLKVRIADPNLLWLIERFLKAGVMESGKYGSSDIGTPQGGIVSPILANIYLHYVLDLWFEKIIKRKAKGYMQMIRYSDDFVVCCESGQDAKDFLEALERRFEKFGLEVANEKTQVLKFGKKEWLLASKQGRRAKTFNFLGFTHYGKRSRKGYWVMSHKTEKSRLSRKLKEITGYIKSVRNTAPLKEWWPAIQIKLLGHINYFGISGNFKALEQFRRGVLAAAFKWINRRSQKKSMNWDKFTRFLEFNPLPQSRIRHAMY